MAELLSWFCLLLFVTSLARQLCKHNHALFSRLHEVFSKMTLMLTSDEMLPFSKYMHKISPYTGTPIISVWINVFFCACLGLIDLASYTAISAIFNVSQALYLTNSRFVPLPLIGVIVFPFFARYLLSILPDNRSSGLRILPLGRSISDEHRGISMFGHVVGQHFSALYFSSQLFDPSLFLI